MQIARSKIEQLRDYIEKPQHVVILAHTNPDGDAIGSSLAWAEVLKRHGHDVTCILPNKFPYYLDFMPGCGDMVIYKHDESRATDAVRKADLIFCLDFHTMSRLDGLGDLIVENQHAKRILWGHLFV